MKFFIRNSLLRKYFNVKDFLFKKRMFMSHSKLSLKDAADFLHIPSQDLKFLVDRGKIPYLKERGKTLFRQNELKDWATHTLFKDKNKKLGKHNFSVSQVWSKEIHSQNLLSKYVNFNTIALNINARTKPSLLKELVNIAQNTYLVTDSEKLLHLIIKREEQLATGLTDGVAIPHPKIHDKNLFLDSFLIIGTVPGGIPFGSFDGEKSDIFFMPCADSDQTHIFMISRLASLIKKTKFVSHLRSLDDPSDVLEILELYDNEIANTAN